MRFLFIPLILLLVSCGKNPKQYDDIERPEGVTLMEQEDGTFIEVLEEEVVIDSLRLDVENVRGYEPKGFHGYHTPDLYLFELEGCTYIVYYFRSGAGLKHFAGCQNPIHQHQILVEE